MADSYPTSAHRVPDRAPADSREHKDLLKDEDKLASQVQRDYRLARDATSEWRDEVHDLYDLVAGDQWDDVTRVQMLDQLRPLVTFNVTSKFLDAVSGLQVQNRQEVRYIPREAGDAEANELLTHAAQWARDQCDADDEDSEAFYDLLLGGMGWTETFIDTDMNTEGDIRIERRDPLEMYWDTSARKKDLEDSRWIMRVRPVTVEEIEERWPEKAQDVVEASAGANEVGTEETWSDALHDAQNAWRYDRQGPWPQSNRRGKLALVEYQWFVREKMHRVKISEGSRDVTTKQWGRLKQFLENNGVPYEETSVPRRRYYRAFVTGRTVLEKSVSPYQGGFTYQVLTGRRDRNNNTWYGMGRVLRDPQLWLNKFFAEILHTINTNSKGGIMAYREAFENPQKAEEEWARPDAITWLNRMSDGQGNPAIVPKPPAPYPAGMDKLMTFSMNALPEVSGLNMEILGLTGKVQAGVVEAQRREAGMTMIAWCFDARRRHIKQQGRIMADYIRNFISDGRLIRIEGERGAQYVPLLKQPDLMQYDVIVDQAPTSPNMKEKVWSMLLEIIPSLVQLGAPVPPEILDYSPLPKPLANKWKQAFLQAQQAAQQDPRAKAEADKTLSETERNQAAAKELLTQAMLNQAKAGQAGGETEKLSQETRKVAAETGRLIGGDK
jgi:hypothetical protein